MKISCYQLGLLETNCYVIESETAAAIVDPGGYSKVFDEKLDELGDKLKFILLTHCHFDHTQGVNRVKKKIDVPVYAFGNDAEGVNDPKKNGLRMFGMFGGGDIEVARILADGDIIRLGNLDIKVMHTPGHSSGSCCFICEDTIISGDTLFRLGFGRTDIGDGSFSELEKSLHKLFALEGDYRVLSGHGSETTLSFERKYNPILQG